MPFLLSALGGAGIAWILIESGYAIEAFILLCVWIVLLYVAPALSFYFLGAVIALSIIAVAVMFWEWTLGLLLGALLCILILGGLMNAVEVLTK